MYDLSKDLDNLKLSPRVEKVVSPSTDASSNDYKISSKNLIKLNKLSQNSQPGDTKQDFTKGLKELNNFEIDNIKI